MHKCMRLRLSGIRLRVNGSHGLVQFQKIAEYDILNYGKHR